jgi:hypothetical protein
MRPVGTDVAESRCDWMVDAVEGSPVAQDMAWWSPDSNTVRFIGTCGYHLRCTVATAYDALPVALPLPPSNFLYVHLARVLELTANFFVAGRRDRSSFSLCTADAATGECTVPAAYDRTTQSTHLSLYPNVCIEQQYDQQPK